MDKRDEPTYKFEEQLTWDSAKNGFAICIGFNPAKAEQHIDRTNRMLIKKIKDENHFFADVGGYILLNLSSRIAKKKCEIKLETRSLSSECKTIVQLLSLTPSVPVILFFGCVKPPLPKFFVDFFLSREKVFFTGGPNHFFHPAYRWNFNFFQLTIANVHAMRWEDH